jgi:hypothetical protein
MGSSLRDLGIAGVSQKGLAPLAPARLARKATAFSRVRIRAGDNLERTEKETERLGSTSYRLDACRPPGLPKARRGERGVVALALLVVAICVASRVAASEANAIRHIVEQLRAFACSTTQALGCLGEVKDEGHFWEHRDVKALVETVGEWNGHVAAIVGRIKDQVFRPSSIRSPPSAGHFPSRTQTKSPFSLRT